ncbi:hypothetical protein C8255_13325 [filamentous cyanobacterium CCP3]|nr:hypothetical protein C8255_13325 [filamentous cyanobacterium CCP3]
MAPPPNSHPTTPEAEFLREILEQIEQASGNQEKIYQLLQAGVDRINESLLTEVPYVFEELITGQTQEKQKTIAQAFWWLGYWLNETPLGNRALNLELSIDAHKQALKFFDRKAFPYEWAAEQNNLGRAYNDRIRGERADNLERAIAAYQAALQVRTRDGFPQDWAMTQNNLGTAYLNRIRGERAENLENAFVQTSLEKAIAAYEAALQVRTRDAFPQQWAATQNNLGTAYSDAAKQPLRERIRGERAENLENAFVQTSLEKAIAAYQAALQVYTRDAFPQQWAETQGNLVLSLLDRYKLTGKADDLDEAISGLQEAQAVAVPGTDGYTNISYTLGTALDYRFSLHNDLADLRQAADAYRRAAETTPWEGNKLNYYEKAADSLYQLGVALTQDGQWYEGLAALETSHATYREAHSRLGRADALQQMGRTHYLMSNFDKARIYFRDALRLYEAEGSLPGQAACHAGLGRLMLRLNFVDDAIAELHQACALYTQLDDQARLGEVQQVYDLAQKVRAKQPLAATLSPPSP